MLPGSYIDLPGRDYLTIHFFLPVMATKATAVRAIMVMDMTIMELSPVLGLVVSALESLVLPVVVPVVVSLVVSLDLTAETIT